MDIITIIIISIAISTFIILLKHNEPQCEHDTEYANTLIIDKFDYPPYYVTFNKKNMDKENEVVNSEKILRLTRKNYGGSL